VRGSGRIEKESRKGGSFPLFLPPLSTFVSLLRAAWEAVGGEGSERGESRDWDRVSLPFPPPLPFFLFFFSIANPPRSGPARGQRLPLEAREKK